MKREYKHVCYWDSYCVVLLLTFICFFECTTFAPATIAPVQWLTPMLNVTLTLILILILTLPRTKNPMNTLTLTLCCRRYHCRSNCRRSKCRITAFSTELFFTDNTSLVLVCSYVVAIVPQMFKNVKMFRRAKKHGCLNPNQPGLFWRLSCGGGLQISAADRAIAAKICIKVECDVNYKTIVRLFFIIFYFIWIMLIYAKNLIFTINH